MSDKNMLFVASELDINTTVNSLYVFFIILIRVGAHALEIQWSD